MKDKHPLPGFLAHPFWAWISAIAAIFAAVWGVYVFIVSESKEDESPAQTTTLFTEVSPASTEPPAISMLTEREKAFKLAEEGVSYNEEWITFSKEINDVEMVLVPKGCFMMGSEEGNANKQPIHQQCFDEPFWIDKTEVTRAAYQACVEAGACGARAVNESSNTDNQPINSLSWFDAHNYCEWRGGRLPTEAEWEYAARGPDNLVYPWGNEFVRENAVYVDNSENRTAEVGSRPEGISWVGALDMSGNVWEWTASPSSSASGTVIVRGGSWENTSSALILTNSLEINQEATNDNRGVRCVASSPLH